MFMVCGISSDDHITDLPFSLIVEEFWKSKSVLAPFQLRVVVYCASLCVAWLWRQFGGSVTQQHHRRRLRHVRHRPGLSQFPGCSPGGARLCQPKLWISATAAGLPAWRRGKGELWIIAFVSGWWCGWLLIQSAVYVTSTINSSSDDLGN